MKIQSLVRTVGIFYAIMLPGLATAAEKSAHVTRVGTCWTGYWAVVASMDNGDSLLLGNLADDIGKARMAAALTAKATGDAVYYQIQSTETACSIVRSDVEWWVVGGSLY